MTSGKILGRLGCAALPVLVIALVWIGIAESPPDRPPPTDYSAHALDEKVGLYHLDDGVTGLLTYSATGALRLWKVSDKRFSSDNVLARSFAPREGDLFLWERGDDLAARQVRFERDDLGAVRGFRWTEASGEEGFAERERRPPFTVRQLEWRDGDVPLSGTAFLPAGPGPHPGAVLIHGSGDSDRDGLWYVHFATHLAEHGIAALLPDKRGCGRSGGEWRTASFADFAADTLAGREALIAAARLDPARVGVVGLSQGGSWIAPVAVSMEPSLPFLVSLVGAAVTPNAQLAHEIRQDLRGSGLPVALAPAAIAVAKQRKRVWWRKNGELDPIPLWRAAEAPVLVILGAEDELDNVPVAESVRRLEEVALEKENLELHVIEGVGHGLFHQDSRQLDAGMLDLLASWILEQGPRSPTPPRRSAPAPSAAPPPSTTDPEP